MPFSKDALHAQESECTYQSTPCHSAAQLLVGQSSYLESDRLSKSRFGTECLEVFACIFRIFDCNFVRLIPFCIFICFI